MTKIQVINNIQNLVVATASIGDDQHRGKNINCHLALYPSSWTALDPRYAHNCYVTVQQNQEQNVCLVIARGKTSVEQKQC